MTDNEVIQQLMAERDRLWQALCAALGLGSYLAQTIWRVVRERNYSRELCHREQQRNISRENELLRSNIERQNEMLRVLATAYASAEPATLDDLLNRAEHDWNLRSSKTPPAD
jgi:predicted amino acid dehydrogenase